MKKSFKLSTKLCTFLFLLICLIFCGVVAWEIGSDAAIETVLVAREKIVGAEPYLATKQVNVTKGLLYGVPVFVIGGLFSVTLPSCIMQRCGFSGVKITVTTLPHCNFAARYFWLNVLTITSL